MALDIYNEKRDFSKTNEPHGDTASNAAGRRFVVQEHHARALHYDFRLEIDGVLKSWAVPKGPPLTTKVRRLAIQTEDHPVSYIDYSGTIAPGNYGAGEVAIWDHGTFEILGQRSADECFKRGKIELGLFGERLNGKFDLIRIDDDKGEWIFIKSIKPLNDDKPETSSPENRTIPGKAEPLPSLKDVNCMLAVTRKEPFSDPGWYFEIKWDGYRSLLFKDEGTVHLVSRNKKMFDGSFKELSDLGDLLNCRQCILDGEIVALSDDGRPHFQSLQNRTGFRNDRKHPSAGDTKTTICYMAFDILYLDGKNLRAVPLKERLTILSQTVRRGGPIRISDPITGEGIALFEKVKELGIEGIIGKKSDSAYVGHRSDDWVKIKTKQTLDALVVGYTESESLRRQFASLLLAAYSQNKLVFIGHVGTGFNESTMSSILSEMHKLEADSSPVEPEPRANGRAHWLKPELVCEVSYGEVTGDGQLRHPVFVKLRDDKRPEDCQLDDQISAETVSYERTDIPRSLQADTTDDKATELIDGHNVSLTHLKKVFWPKTGTTKRDLLRHYAEVSPTLLPHLLDRPLVFQRFPDGVGGMNFFQHNAGDKLPDFIRTYNIEEQGDIVKYALCDDEAGLLYFINLGAIPLHIWNERITKLGKPDRIIFDLDPGDRFEQAVPVAQALKKLLDELGLASYPKTSGANGLHITVPVKPIYDDNEITSFARLVAETIERRSPEQVTTQRRTRNRKVSQVYLDFLQNGHGKTVVSPYSVRPQPTPTVSTPLSWSEVTPDLNPEAFTIDTVPKRLTRVGDLYSPLLQPTQVLGKAVEKVKRISSGLQHGKSP